MALDRKSFHRKLRYQVTATAPQLIADMQEIAEQDSHAERRQGKFISIAVIFGIATFGSLFLGGTALGPYLIVFGLIVTIITGALASSWGRRNIANHRYELAQSLAEMVARDMAPQAMLQMSLDCNRSIQSAKRIDRIPHPRRKGWKIDRYRDPWLQLRGKFLDSTQFDLGLTTLAVSKHGWSRSRSGKSKHKRKNQLKGFEVYLMLTFPRKQYGAITALQSELEAAVKLPEAAQLKQLKVSERQLGMKVKVSGQWPALRKTRSASRARLRPDGQDPIDANALYQLVTQMFLSAYQILNLSRALSQPTAGTSS
ncbi:hypothetical protein [Vasconcelosia minhoensis]|nr:hypothetical protein [Romeria gracilis]